MAPTQKSKIVIVSEFQDNASPKIVAAFKKQEVAAESFSKEIGKMRNSIRRSMNKNSKETTEALNGIAKAFQKTEKATEKSKKEIGRWRVATEGMRRSIGSLRNILLLFFFVFRPLQSFFKDITEAMVRQEDATKRLNIALELQGTFTTETSIGLQKLADAFQNTTRFGDEAVEEVFQQLISVGNVLPSQLRKATAATLDFASATGRDVRTAALVVSKAMAGYTGELSRYGIILDQNIPAAKRAEKALEAMNRQFGGFAKRDIDSFSGSLEQMKARFSDLKESIATLITTKIPMQKIFDELAKILEALNFDTGESRLQQITKELADIEVKLDNIKQRNLEDILLSAIAGAKIIRALKGQFQFKEDLLASQIRLNKELDEALIKEERLNNLRGNLRIVRSGTEGIIKTTSQFAQAINSLQAQGASTQIKDLNERTANFQDMVDRQLEIVTQFENERELLVNARNQARGEEEKKLVEAEIGALNVRGDRLNTFYANAGKLDELRLKDFASILGRQVDFIDSFGKASATALENGFFKVLTGRFEELEDVVLAFGQTLLRVMLQIASVQILSSLFGGFGGGGSVLKPTSVVSLIPSQHQGGYMRSGLETSSGAGTSGMPTRHAGRYKSGGTVQAILEEGEGVLNKAAMRGLGVDNLNKLNNGQGVGGTQITNVYNISAIDVKSFRDMLNQNGDIFAGAAERGIADNRQIRKTIQRFAT